MNTDWLNILRDAIIILAAAAAGGTLVGYISDKELVEIDVLMLLGRVGMIIGAGIVGFLYKRKHRQPLLSSIMPLNTEFLLHAFVVAVIVVAVELSFSSNYPVDLSMVQLAIVAAIGLPMMWLQLVIYMAIGGWLCRTKADNE